MSTGVSVLACLLLLIATGWWIGREFARDVTASGRRLTVVLGADVLPVREMERRLQKAFRRLAPAYFVTMTREALSGPGVVQLVQQDARTVLCKSAVIRPESSALRQVTLKPEPDVGDWDLFAAIVLAHGNIVFETSKLNTVPARFESVYLAAWVTLRTALNGAENSDSMQQVHAHLHHALSHWPADRLGEKPGALANLAALCLAMPEPAERRLPRLLEGLDAAKQALLDGYDAPADHQITGLRDLIAAIRSEIANDDDSLPREGASIPLKRNRIHNPGNFPHERKAPAPDARHFRT
ncbi:MAG: hypothetical protein ACR2O4_04230 [Hyphomicrobiaceae bacterium]